MTQQTPASRSDRSPQLVLTYDRYLDNYALLAGLRTLQVARPDLLTLSELGRSTEDQPIWLATVGRGSAAEVQGRFLQANLAAQHLQLTVVLPASYYTNPAIQAFLWKGPPHLPSDHHIGLDFRLLLFAQKRSISRS